LRSDDLAGQHRQVLALALPSASHIVQYHLKKHQVVV
jgi:hypothetical protein